MELLQLRGLVSTNLALSKKRYTTDILHALEKRITLIDSTSVVCDLLETIAMLRESLGDEPAIVESLSKEANRTATTSDGRKPALVSDAVTSNQKTADADLLVTNKRLLSAIATRSAEMTDIMTAAELRRVLCVYSLLPFRSDELVTKIEEEVGRRKTKLTRRFPPETTMQDRLLLGASYAQMLKDHLDGHGRSPFSALKNGLKSLFGSNADNNDEDETISTEQDGAAKAAELEHIEAALQSIIDLSEGAADFATASRVSFDKVTRDIEQGTLFELGRCSELIAHYRRIDFESGQRKTRFDQDLRRDMTKRVLSRLMPKT